MSDEDDHAEHDEEALDHGDYHGEHDEGHEHGDADRPAYDPENAELPSRAPPLRSTAPQSAFTQRQVGVGFGVLLVGLLVTFGLAVLLA